MNRKKLATIGAASAIALAAVPALAQDTGDATTEETAGPTPKQERRAERQAAFAEALAAELGLPVEDVDAALTDVREQMRAQRDAERAAALQERLDQAVADGELTQEQADAIADAAEAGVLPGPRGPRGHHGPRGW